MLRRLTLIVSGALCALGLTVVPAQAATYVVTLTTNRTGPDVGETLTVAGKVTGSGAGKKAVAVQRRVPGGAWKTVRTVTTKSNGTYTTTYKIGFAGTQELRATTAAKGSVKAGKSAIRTITGWKWLDLALQPHYTQGRVVVGTPNSVSGSYRPRSVELIAGTGGSSITWALENLCKDSDIDVGLRDTAPNTPQDVDITTDDGGDTVQAEKDTLTGANRVTIGSAFLTMSRSSASGPGIIIVTPRLKCKVSTLPDVGIL